MQKNKIINYISEAGSYLFNSNILKKPIMNMLGQISQQGHIENEINSKKMFRKIAPKP